MKISDSDTFELNEFVFSKLKGYPWWPGQIIKIDKNGKKFIYLCADPYTNTISRISDNKYIAKFEDNIGYIIKNLKSKKHSDAICAAIENIFEGTKIPKKYKNIMDELKKENNWENNKINQIEKKSSKDIEEKPKKDIKNKNKKAGEIKNNENITNEKTMSIDEEKDEKKEIKKNIKIKEMKKEKDNKKEKKNR